MSTTTIVTSYSHPRPPQALHSFQSISGSSSKLKESKNLQSKHPTNTPPLGCNHAASLKQPYSLSPLLLPTAIWIQIASYLPASTVQKLVGLNAAFFELAMDLKYRQVSFAYLDERMVKLVSRLRDPAVARRVRILHIYPGFLKEVHDRTRTRSKSPFSHAKKYASSLLYKISDMFSPHPHSPSHALQAHVSTSPPSTSTSSRRRSRSHSHTSPTTTSAFSFTSSRTHAPGSNSNTPDRPLSLVNTDELLRVLLEVLKSLDGVTDYYVTWPDHALRLWTEVREDYGYYPGLGSGSSSGTGFGNSYNQQHHHHPQGSSRRKNCQFCVGGQPSRHHGAAAQSCHSSCCCSSSSCVSNSHSNSHHSSSHCLSSHSQSHSSLCSVHPHLSSHSFSHSHPHASSHLQSHPHTSYPHSHSHFSTNAHLGHSNTPLNPSSAVPFLTSLFSCRTLRKLSLDISLGNVRELVGGAGDNLEGLLGLSGFGALGEMVNLEELDLCLHVPIGSGGGYFDEEGCCRNVNVNVNINGDAGWGDFGGHGGGSIDDLDSVGLRGKGWKDDEGVGGMGIFGMGIGKPFRVGDGRERRGSEPVIRGDDDRGGARWIPGGGQEKSVMRLGEEKPHSRLGLKRGLRASSSNLRELKPSSGVPLNPQEVKQGMGDLSFVSLGVPGMMYVSPKSTRSAVLSTSPTLGSPLGHSVLTNSPLVSTLTGSSVSPMGSPLSASVLSPSALKPTPLPHSSPLPKSPWTPQGTYGVDCQCRSLTMPLSPLVTHLLPALSSSNIQRSLKVLGLQVQMQAMDDGGGRWFGVGDEGLGMCCGGERVGCCAGISASSSCAGTSASSSCTSIASSASPGHQIPNVSTSASSGTHARGHASSNVSPCHHHHHSHPHAHPQPQTPQHALTPLLSSLHLPALRTLTLNIPIEAPCRQFCTSDSLAKFLLRHRGGLAEVRMRGREGGMVGGSSGGAGGVGEVLGGVLGGGVMGSGIIDIMDMGMGDGIIEVEGMEGLLGGVEMDGGIVTGDGDQRDGESKVGEANGVGVGEGAFDKWMREVMGYLEDATRLDTRDIREEKGRDVSSSSSCCDLSVDGDVEVEEGRSRTNEGLLMKKETTKRSRTTLPLPNLTTLDISSALFPVSTALAVVETLTGSGRVKRSLVAGDGSNDFEHVGSTGGGGHSNGVENLDGDIGQFERSMLKRLSLTGCYWMQDDMEKVLDCVAPLVDVSKDLKTTEVKEGLKSLRMSLHTLTPRVLKMLNMRLGNPEFVDSGLGECVAVMSRGMRDSFGSGMGDFANAENGEGDSEGVRERCRVELIVKCGNTRASMGSVASSLGVGARMREKERERRRVMKTSVSGVSKVGSRRSGSSSGSGMMDMSMRETSMGPVSILAAQNSRALRKASKSASTSTSTSSTATATGASRSSLHGMVDSSASGGGGVEVYIR